MDPAPGRRVVDVDGVCTDVGRVLGEPCGAIRLGSGACVREVFLERADWYNTTWITADGDAYQRWYNPWSGRWAFSARKRVAVADSGELTICVGSGDAAASMRLCRAIALAWVEVPRLPHALVATQLSASDGLCAENIGWLRRGAVRRLTSPVYHVDEARAVPEDAPAAAAATAATAAAVPLLRREWAPHEATVLPLDAYRIDARGGVRRADDGAPVRPIDSYNGRQRLALPEGSVWVPDLVACTFGEYCLHPSRGLAFRDGDCGNCALANLREEGRKCRSVELRVEAYALFAGGASVAEVAERMGVHPATIWERLDAAAEALPITRIEPAFWSRAVACERIREAIALLYDAKHPVLGGTLAELARAIYGEADDADLDEGAYGMLRLARQLARRTRHRQLAEDGFVSALAWHVGP